MGRFISDMLGSEELRAALQWSGLAAVLAALAATVMTRRRPLPIGGAAIAGAAAWVMVERFRMPIEAVVGVAALGAAGLIGRRLWDRVVLSLPGAYLVSAMGDLPESLPVIPFAIVVAIAAALVADFDSRDRHHGVGLPMMVLSIGGVIVTVPDTERAAILVGAALPWLVMGPPLRLARLGPAAGAVVGMIAWVGGTAWTGRPGATVGALAALGFFLAEPVGRLLARRPTAVGTLLTGGLSGAVTVFGIHGVLVIAGSRFAGLLDGALPAALLAVGFIAAGAVLAAAPTPPDRA